ncbi:hypothetical protein [Peterkaempfera sp. SMS 1(5)a]|uniref:hypothetical protein n=1 Tax=Peterkaempfera podocarpi TaxID=3232308 RepID=UPI00367360D8
MSGWLRLLLQACAVISSLGALVIVWALYQCALVAVGAVRGWWRRRAGARRVRAGWARRRRVLAEAAAEDAQHAASATNTPPPGPWGPRDGCGPQAAVQLPRPGRPRSVMRYAAQAVVDVEFAEITGCPIARQLHTPEGPTP